MDLPCNNCGKCCYFIVKGVKTKCPFLILLPNGKTKCKEYHNRLGKTIGPGVKCGMRENVRLNFTGCPNNKEGQKTIW